MAPPINTSGKEFEVFLSFRGPDTRDNFTSCLYHAMNDKGIRVFKDDEELRVGEKIGGNLLRALDDSQFYIPIFSKGFASSPWCLREVAHMVDCTSKSAGKKEILPVFFDVKPDDVKLKTKLYRDALTEHEKKYTSHEVKRWGDALVEVPAIVGWRLEEKGYGELIELIVRGLLLKLKAKNRDIPDHLVETADLKHIENLLDADSNDHVRFLIIHGVGGIGKSTLAGVIFNRCQSKFKCSSFLDDVPHQGLLDVQKKLLSDTLGSTSSNGVHDTNDGINRIRRGLSNKKALVVLDNVDAKRQLDNLAGRCDWFGSGSRIIITLRDRSIILDKDNQTLPSNYLAYPMMEMPIDRAIQLFSKHAFRSDTPPEGCYDFSEGVVSTIGRLPLTLEVVGSLFANTTRSEWDDTLEDLKQVPHKDVQKTLMTSINKLDAIEKAIFLDIACFGIGEDKTYADYMWRSSGYSPRSAIDVLLLMSLIKIDHINRLWMHDEVRDLGRYIVTEENIEDVGDRRWVRIDENTLDILRSNKEKRAVRALSLDISHDLTPEELACLPMLKFLGGKRLNFVGDFKNLLPSLRWLSWRHRLLDFSAKNLHLVKLVVLDLSGSNITDDWGGWRQIEMAKELKILDLTQCYELTKTPDFSKLGKLEKLILAFCQKLSKIDGSIGKLKLLSSLNIKGCHSLEGLPEEIGALERLSEIIMPEYGCLFKLPETLGNLRSLLKFEIHGCDGIIQLPRSIGRLNLTHLVLSHLYNLYELPESIGELKSLIMLDLNSSGISTLPDSIGKLKNLKRLLLYNCKNQHELPDSIGELEALVELNLKSSGISTLPDSIGRLASITHLSFSVCNNLRKLPESIGELKSLIMLDLNSSRISTLPDSIGRLKNLERLLLYNCKNLRELPDSIGELEALVELNLKSSRISILPNSIGRLKNLRVLLLEKCEDLLGLPESIGELEALDVLNLNYSGIFDLPDSIERLKNLEIVTLHDCWNLHDHLDVKSLVELKLNSLRISIPPYLIRRLTHFTHFTHFTLSGCKNLYELPDSIGQMELLVELDLQSSGIALLPNSIGNLKRLKVLNVSRTKIRTIPCALGGVETLEELDASFCPHLVDEIPWEMWSLTSLRILNLEGSPISTVPMKISGFSSLQTLNMASYRLSPLPELPSSLKCLVVAAAEFPVLPNLSGLVLLHHLEVRKEQPGLTFFIPEELTSPWSDPQSIDQLPPSLSTLKLHSIPQLQDISGFLNLSVLTISECLMPHLPDLSRLKELQELRLSNFPELAEIPGLGEMESLKYLHITRCDVIKQLPNLSKLRNLLHLELKNCAKLRAVEGLKELEKLENAVIRYCRSLERLPDVSASTKLDTNWTPPEEPAEDAIQPAKRLRLSLD